MSALLLLKFEEKEPSVISSGHVVIEFGEETTELEKHYAYAWRKYIAEMWENLANVNKEKQQNQDSGVEGVDENSEVS